MKRAGVIGYPLEHSLSPALFGAAYEAAGVDATHEAWATPPDELEARVAGLRDDCVMGANVTIPHKEAVVPFLDHLDERAELAGAVNTIANEGGELVGYNTDVGGFARSLRDDAGFDPKGKRTFVLGAGGAARAVALALVEGGASIIQLAGRTPARLDKITSGLRARTNSGTTITWAHWLDGVFLTELPRADLVVNCTPVGTKGSEGQNLSPVEAELLPTDGIVFDLVYNPQVTPLLNDAKKRGAKPVSGLGMLVYQAAESFTIWTGKDAPADKMMDAAQAALGA